MKWLSRWPVLRDGLQAVLGGARPPPMPALPQPDGGSPGGSHGNARQGAPHVLLVEDHPVNLEISREMLIELGCRVTTAENGADAVDAVRRGCFDLVLMDCQMPVMDGFEATRRIRATERELGRSPVPVVALTANTMAGDRAQCIAAGMTDHLAKPVPLRELARVIDARMARRPEPEGPARTGAGGDAAPAGPSVGPGVLLDEAQLLSVPGMAGRGGALIARMAALFRKESGIGFAALCAAVDAADVKAVRDSAHRLKSSCGALGARAAYERARSVENAARSGCIAFDENARRDLECILLHTCEALDAMTAKMTSADTTHNEGAAR